MGQQLDETFDPHPTVHEAGEAIAALPFGAGPLPPRLLLQRYPVPSARSTLVHWGALWWLATYPQSRVTVVRYSDPAALQMGRRLRDLVRTRGREMGGLKIAGHTPEHRSWELASGGRLLVCTPRDRPRAQADLLLVDDPHQFAVEAVQPGVRAKTVEGLRGFLDRHLADGAPAIVVGRPGHRDDLIGQILREPAGWKIQ